MFGQLVKTSNGKTYDGMIASIGLATSVCTIIVSFGQWMSDHYFYYIAITLILTLATLSLYHYYYVYKPKTSLLKRTIARGILTSNLHIETILDPPLEKRKVPLYYCNSRFTSVKRCFTAFRANSNGSLRSRKRRGNMVEGGSGGGSRISEPHVRFQQVTEEERVLERSVVRINCERAHMLENEEDDEDGDCEVSGFRQPKSSSCCNLTNRWKRKKRKSCCDIM